MPELPPGLRAIYSQPAYAASGDLVRKPLNTTPAHLPPYLPNTPDMFFGLGRWARNAVNSGKLPDFAKANTGIGGAGIGAAVGGTLGAAASGIHNFFNPDRPLDTMRTSGVSAALGSLMGLWRQRMHAKPASVKNASVNGDALLSMLTYATDIPDGAKATLMMAVQQMGPMEKAQLLNLLRTAVGGSVGALIGMFLARTGLIPAAAGFALGAAAVQPPQPTSYLPPHSLYY